MNFTEDDWLTPPEILLPLGVFDLDPASPIKRPWDTALNHFTKLDDGFSRPWFGRVWLNPPYSEVEKWMDKMKEHGNGMALVNSRTETNWFFKSIWNAAHAVLFFRKRIEFFRPDGSYGEWRSAIGQAMAAYTAEDAEALYQAKFDGKFVPLVITFVKDLKPTTWKSLVRRLMSSCGGRAKLEQLYELAAAHPKVSSNPNWRAKIRQQVQEIGVRVGPSEWQSILSLDV